MKKILIAVMLSSIGLAHAGILEDDKDTMFCKGGIVKRGDTKGTCFDVDPETEKKLRLIWSQPYTPPTDIERLEDEIKKLRKELEQHRKQ